MKKRPKAIYDVITTYGMHRKVIFQVTVKAGKTVIEIINTRTGEYLIEPYKKEYHGDFIDCCESFIRMYFGEHLNYFILEEYLKEEEEKEPQKPPIVFEQETIFVKKKIKENDT